MNLQEYRNKHNNDPVFNIADKVNELKKEFSVELKDYYKTKCKIKNATEKLGKFFYYIFIHNVGFKYFGTQNLNNSYGYLLCSTINYRKIDRYYRVYLDFLYKKLFIIYPLNKSNSTGKVAFKATENIIKPVKIAREIIEEYSDEQLQMFCQYLIQQDDDPEGVAEFCNRVQFVNESDSRVYFMQQKHKKKISLSEQLTINKHLNNKILLFSKESSKFLYRNNYSNLLNFNLDYSLLTNSCSSFIVQSAQKSFNNYLEFLTSTDFSATANFAERETERVTERVNNYNFKCRFFSPFTNSCRLGSLCSPSTCIFNLANVYSKSSAYLFHSDLISIRPRAIFK